MIIDNLKIYNLCNDTDEGLFIVEVSENNGKEKNNSFHYYIVDKNVNIEPIDEVSILNIISRQQEMKELTESQKYKLINLILTKKRDNLNLDNNKYIYYLLENIKNKTYNINDYDAFVKDEINNIDKTYRKKYINDKHKLYLMIYNNKKEK